MYLKKLEIQGFKSFADKIRLDFAPGITSVVGPNGSGKSNISDAVRWVLGEQSIKTLRGGKMEDVIFAGTQHRKPLGFAEVSLTIDNFDKLLPVEYAEVTVTRRVYRSGESEFMINKTPCRLKDIYELFLDTGVGRDGYSIIGQGRVDEILSSRSEDRRRIFEEALGIMKYKIRKIEAEKKLEMTNQNLSRINDILIELEGQLDPMKEQAETAKKYLLLRDELKEIEISLYVENIARLDEKVKEYEEKHIICKTDLDTRKESLNGISKQNEEKLEYLKQLEEELNFFRNAYHGLEAKENDINSKVKVNEEKKYGLEKELLRLEKEVLNTNNKIEALEKEKNSKQEELISTDQEHKEALIELSELENESTDSNKILNEKEKLLEDMNRLLLDKLEKQSDKKMQLNNAKNFIDGITQRQTAIEIQLADCFSEKAQENDKKETLLANLEKTKKHIEEASNKINVLRLEKQKLETRLLEENKKRNDVISELQLKTSRLRILSDMENNLEGYYRSVKNILKECSSSQEFGKGIHGALAKLINVSKKYELAIETALGSILQNIVTDTEYDAKKAIEYLKKNKMGRATFLPISSVKGKYLDAVIYNKIKTQKGFCQVASDLIECDEKFKGIILSLLGRVIVVENLDSAINIAKETDHKLKIVTLEGDVLNAGGAMSGGSSENKDIGLLSRNREIAELKNLLEDINTHKNRLEKIIRDLTDTVNKVVNDIALEENNLRSYELKKATDESILRQVCENLKRYDGKIELLGLEKNELLNQLSESKNEHSCSLKELESMDQEITKLKEDMLGYQEALKDKQAAKESLLKALTELKIKVGMLKKSVENIKENLQRILSEIKALENTLLKINQEAVKCKNDMDGLKNEDASFKDTISNIMLQKQEVKAKLEALSDKKKLIEEESRDILNNINAENKSILLLQEELSKIEIKKARAESEIEAIKSRLWDEYELTYTNSLEYKKFEKSFSDQSRNNAEAEKRISELKNSIKELGIINISAIEEYKKLKERYEFLSAQKTDMENACEKLKKVINEMVLIMKSQFVERFEMINKNFNEVFKELFNGGRAELILADKGNVLETDIEIQVQPPGKKLQNMMLLSGGERAFTAIALLFSIIKLHPTPFCVLDEIEAALDDANVYRFAEYLKKHVHLTQFIIITHRKGTMEASDTLYGVTMQEHGISKVVSMRLGEKAS